MLVQQSARFLHQQKQPHIIFKLDILKAFDSVSWDFLIEVIKKLGFRHIWCDMISGLLATSSTQILLNGVPREFIAHQRGLRQGDPLSPMLFILIMDILSLLVQRASEEGHLQPLSLYADDAAIFLKPDPTDINLVLDILKLFGMASGLQTNVQKVVSCLSDVMIKLLQLLKNCCLVSLLNSRVNISSFPSLSKI
jgi:hypothetical protein